MNVDDTVRRAIWWYPMLFKNRTDVLHHLFYVIGNGYAWENGEIVEQGRSYTEDHDVDAAISNDETDEFLGDLHRRWNEEAREIRATIDERIHDLSDLSANKFSAMPSWPGVKHWYPLYDSALINHIPDDVKPDWAEAAEQIRKLYGT